MLKRLAILALLCVPFVSAKSYVISLPNKTQVGTAVLKPGDYSLSVNGSEACLRTTMATGQSHGEGGGGRRCVSLHFGGVHSGERRDQLEYVPLRARRTRSF